MNYWQRAWATAPGKIILVGEHAVVYGQPAIALPVTQVRAEVVAQAGKVGAGIVIHAADIGRQYMAAAAPPEEPLAFTCRSVLEKLGYRVAPDVLLTLRSTIPIASGLGSGAATATAIAKALARFLGYELSPPQISDLVYETEKIHHGTPSGIDNTVIAYQQPLWFVRGQPTQLFQPKGDFHLVIADTGIHSPTRHTVGDVKVAQEREPEKYHPLFAEIGALVHAARHAVEQGDAPALGILMNQNHQLLEMLGVSSPANLRLAEVARAAGAYGAKVSGGGRGGNNIAVVPKGKSDSVAQALRAAGATRVITTILR